MFQNILSDDDLRLSKSIFVRWQRLVLHLVSSPEVKNVSVFCFILNLCGYDAGKNDKFVFQVLLKKNSSNLFRRFLCVLDKFILRTKIHKFSSRIFQPVGGINHILL